MADIFQEVDEEVKKDEYLKLWQKYGLYISALAIAIIVAAAAVIGWREYQASQRMAEGQRYEAALALVRGGKTEEAIAAFAELAETGLGYGALAAFREGAIHARAGNMAGAVAAYDSVAADGGADARLRALATLLAVLHGLDSGDPAALVARLEPLAAEDSPWRYSAQELTALAVLRAGDTARAREILTRLADDTGAPPRLRGRAAELLSAIGG